MFNIPGHKEMQIKTMLRFQPFLLESRTQTITNLGKDAGEKAAIIHCW
jgi:hypothetical protein